MWLCFNDGFLSVVADVNDPKRLMVRARRRRDLENIFGEEAEVVETPDADYRWRIFVTRAELQTLVSSRIGEIDYTNFKNSVRQRDLKSMYGKIWTVHRQYQDTDRSGHFAWGPGDLVHIPEDRE